MSEPSANYSFFSADRTVDYLEEADVVFDDTTGLNFSYQA